MLFGEPADANLTLLAENRANSAHAVHFDPPIPLTGMRLQLGGMLGEHDRVELGGGFEAGKAYGGPQRYFSLMFRVGVSIL